MKINQPDSERYAKVLVFSPAGAGKTTFLGTANDDSRTSPMLFLDYEGGTSSLVGRDIDIIKIRSWEDYTAAYAVLKSPKNPYRSVAIDSASESHVFSLLAQLTERSRKMADLLEQADYGIALTQMRRLLRSFRDLPMHVFCTALAKTEVDPRDGSVQKPSFSGILADEAPGIFEAVAYLSTAVLDDDFLHRVLILQNYPKIRTKIRMPLGAVAPNELVDPTVTSILDVLQIPYDEELVEEGAE